MSSNFLDSVNHPDVFFLFGAGCQHELKRTDLFVLGLMDDPAVKHFAGLFLAVI